MRMLFHVFALALALSTSSLRAEESLIWLQKLNTLRYGPEKVVFADKGRFESEHHTFQMRMGLHHGPAIVGSFGGQKRSDYTAIGQTVNIAARIEAQAQPGEILVSMEVRDYLDEGIWELAGNYQLKGVAMPLNLYRIIRLEKKSAA